MFWVWFWRLKCWVSRRWLQLASCSKGMAQSWGSFVVQTSSASKEEQRVFPVHDSLCFAVDGVQDCPTWAPASRKDTTAPPHADICKPEGQVWSLSSVLQEASAGDHEFVFAWQGEQQLGRQIEVGSSIQQKFQPADYYNSQACWWWMHAQVMCM